MYTYADWYNEMQDTLNDPCQHSPFGSCTKACPWCDVIGFYNPREDGDRKYRMCKWCLKIQNVGEQMKQCVYEICRTCRPRFDGTYAEDEVPTIQFSENTRITLFPGHKCKKCKTPMEAMDVFQFKDNPMRPFKDEIDEIHLYKQS